MKFCPACRQAYTDDSLNFCLSDGTVLVQSASTQSMSGLSSAETVVMPAVPDTAREAAAQTIPTWQPSSGYQTTAPARGSSNTWKWVIGGVGTIILLGIIGFFGLFALAMMYGDDVNTNQNKNPANTDKSPVPDASLYKKDDLSLWRREENAFGKTVYEDGEFVMNSKSENYFYVLITKDKDFTTLDATARVTLRNVTGKPTKLGYGLVVHSDPDEALKRNYAFLIDTIKKSYRIVMHTDKKETELVRWTTFAAIRGGTETNEISVKNESGKLTLFINGQMATSVKESGDYKQGVAGLYVSDAIPIAFSNLQLYR